MKSLVVYSSKTGNTRQLADAVAEALPGETEVHAVDTAPAPQGYDLVAIGFWLQAGRPDPAAAAYMERLQGDEKVFLFATHGAAADSAHAAEAMRYASEELATPAAVVGTFNCQGQVDPAVLEKISAKPEPPAWIADAPAAAGHPDAADIARLQDKVKSLARS